MPPETRPRPQPTAFSLSGSMRLKGLSDSSAVSSALRFSMRWWFRNEARGKMTHFFRLVSLVFFRICHDDVRIAVRHSGRRPHEHGRAVLFGQFERLLHHVVGLLGRGRIEARDFRKARERAGILLRLGADRTRIVGHEHDHAALDAYVFHAHQRVGRDVQAHLLHGHKDAGAAVRRACGDFHGRLLVDGPLDVSALRSSLRNGLQHLRRRRARIAAHQVDPGSERAHGDGFVAH